MDVLDGAQMPKCPHDPCICTTVAQVLPLEPVANLQDDLEFRLGGLALFFNGALRLVRRDFVSCGRAVLPGCEEASGPIRLHWWQ